MEITLSKLLKEIAKDIDEIGTDGIIFTCDTCSTVAAEAENIIWKYYDLLQKGELIIDGSLIIDKRREE